jgi:hypothetical protein
MAKIIRMAESLSLPDGSDTGIDAVIDYKYNPMCRYRKQVLTLINVMSAFVNMGGA